MADSLDEYRNTHPSVKDLSDVELAEFLFQLVSKEHPELTKKEYFSRVGFDVEEIPETYWETSPEEDKTAGLFAGFALGVESLGRIPEATRLAFAKKDEEARIAAQQIVMQRQEAERDYGRIVSFTDVMETIEKDIATQYGLDKITEEDLSHPYFQALESGDVWAVKGMQDAFFWEMKEE